MQSRIMYIELKTDGLKGKGRISRVNFSKTGKSIYFNDLTLVSTKGTPLKANYFCEETLEDYWVSNPKRDGNDSLFPAVVEIDADVRAEYWTNIRKSPESVDKKSFRSAGKTKAEREALEKGLRRRQMDNGWMPC
ncbi:MAG: 1-deoxy-D-xylulose-5-phosphate synthase [Pseudomonadota bacterium]